MTVRCRIRHQGRRMDRDRDRIGGGRIGRNCIAARVRTATADRDANLNGRIRRWVVRNCERRTSERAPARGGAA